MGTRAQVSIIVEGQSTGMVYRHYDGFPGDMLPMLMVALEEGQTTPAGLKKVLDDQGRKDHEEDCRAIQGLGPYVSDVSIQHSIHTDLEYFYELDMTNQEVRVRGGHYGANASSGILEVVAL